MMPASVRDTSRPAVVDPLELSVSVGAAEAGFAPDTGAQESWAGTRIPVALALSVGIALGPEGIGLLSSNTLRFVEPLTPGALAALGALLGFSLSGRPARGRMLAVGLLEAAGGIMLFTGASVGLAAIRGAAIPGTPWLFGLVAGICALTFVRPAAGGWTSLSGERQRTLVRAAVAIVAGALVLAVLRTSSAIGSLSMLVQSGIVSLVLATAVWLLLSATRRVTDQRVFALAALLLIGGAADYLSLSALLGGCLAGCFWQIVDGDPRDSLVRDVLYVERPMAMLVLVVAGARAEPSLAALGLAAAYALLAAVPGAVGRVFTPKAVIPSVSDVGLNGLPSTVFGVGIALSAARAAGGEMTTLLTVVVLGTVIAELAGLAGRARSAE